MSKDEIVAIVDRNDNVIGKAPLGLHGDGRPHREIAVMIFNKSGKLLVQKRKDNNLLDVSVAGHPKYGEDYREAAVREIKEELGIMMNPASLIELDKWYREYVSEKWEERLFLCLFKTIGDYKVEEMRLGKAEVKEVTYYDIETLKALVASAETKADRNSATIVPHFAEMLKKYVF